MTLEDGTPDWDADRGDAMGRERGHKFYDLA